MPKRFDTRDNSVKYYAVLNLDMDHLRTLSTEEQIAIVDDEIDSAMADLKIYMREEFANESAEL